jgi:hypothetical protein
MSLKHSSFILHVYIQPGRQTANQCKLITSGANCARDVSVPCGTTGSQVTDRLHEWTHSLRVITVIRTLNGEPLWDTSKHDCLQPAARCEVEDEVVTQFQIHPGICQEELRKTKKPLVMIYRDTCDIRSENLVNIKLKRLRSSYLPRRNWFVRFAYRVDSQSVTLCGSILDSHQTASQSHYAIVYPQPTSRSDYVTDHQTVSQSHYAIVYQTASQSVRLYVILPDSQSVTLRDSLPER